MVSMRKTLLEIVQDVLNDIDGDEVNSISDTVESEQVTNIVISAYFDMIADRLMPDNYEVSRLTGLGDSTTPTHLLIPAGTSKVEVFKYDKSTTSAKEYRPVYYETPEQFLDRLYSRDSTASNVVTVPSLTNSVDLLIYNDKMPSYFTTFDNDYIICDSYLATEEDSLQTSKTMVYGEKIPEVTKTDSFVFDMGHKYFPYLIAEAKSMANIVMLKQANPKAEAIARTHKYTIQKERWKLGEPNRRRGLGRT